LEHSIRGVTLSRFSLVKPDVLSRLNVEWQTAPQTLSAGKSIMVQQVIRLV
jgi:hypothetical protein